MSGGSIEHRTKSGSNFAPTFVVHHVLPDINFNRHCLINNIYMPKKYIYIYIYIYICIYIYIYIYRHVFLPSQDSSVWLGLMSRE